MKQPLHAIGWPEWQVAIEGFEAWLRREDPRSLQHWIERLRQRETDQGQYEGAIAEALTWSYLSSRVDEIALTADFGVGGPDFQCAEAGTTFLVEATNVSIDTATAKSGLEHAPGPKGFSWYGPLNQAIRNKTQAKAGKIKDPGIPVILMVSTLHWQAGILCFDKDLIGWLLTGTSCIQSTIDRDGEPIGDVHTAVTFEDSVFVDAPRKGLVGIPVTVRARQISALVLANFGQVPTRLRPDGRLETQVRPLGILHPDPMHPFRPALLPDVPFGRLIPWPLPERGRVRVGVAWSDEVEAETSVPDSRPRIVIPSEIRFEDLDPNRLRG